MLFVDAVVAVLAAAFDVVLVTAVAVAVAFVVVGGGAFVAVAF